MNGRSKCRFVIFTLLDVQILNIPLNEVFCRTELLPKMTNFYNCPSQKSFGSKTIIAPILTHLLICTAASQRSMFYCRDTMILQACGDVISRPIISTFIMRTFSFNYM